MDNLELRLIKPNAHAVDQRLTRQVLKDQPHENPLKLSDREFNHAAENYYRHEMRGHHIREAFAQFTETVRGLDSWRAWRSGRYNKLLLVVLDGKSAENYLASVSRQLLNDTLPEEEYRRLIHLILLVTLAPCIPATKLIARWVEKKAHAFSIGGAAFVGFMLTPWSLLLLNTLVTRMDGKSYPIMATLAAVSIA